MAHESKLLKLFKLLLGSKYKIVPLSDNEKNNANNITYNQDKDNNKTSISEEAKALFERDQQKYGITTQKEEKPLETNEQDLINEAQTTYDQITKYLSNEIECLSSSKKLLESLT